MFYLTKIIVFLFILFPLSVFAMDMDDCKIGDTVYIDDWIDKKVKVIDKDYSDKTIRVKASDGTKKWFKSSELMTKTGKVWEDAGEDLLQEVGESIVKSIVENWNQGASIHILNNCSYDVKVAILYLSSEDKEWHMEYWYKYKPYEQSYPTLNNGKTLRTNNNILIVRYDNKRGGDFKCKIGGEEVLMTEVSHRVVLCSK